MPRVQVQGTDTFIDFPDNTPPDVMQKALREHFSPKKPAIPIPKDPFPDASLWEDFLKPTAKPFLDVAKGFADSVLAQGTSDMAGGFTSPQADIQSGYDTIKSVLSNAYKAGKNALEGKTGQEPEPAISTLMLAAGLKFGPKAFKWGEDAPAKMPTGTRVLTPAEEIMLEKGITPTSPPSAPPAAPDLALEALKRAGGVPAVTHKNVDEFLAKHPEAQPEEKPTAMDIIDRKYQGITRETDPHDVGQLREYMRSTVGEALQRHPENPVAYFKQWGKLTNFDERFDAARIKASGVLDDFQLSSKQKEQFNAWFNEHLSDPKVKPIPSVSPTVPNGWGTSLFSTPDRPAWKPELVGESFRPEISGPQQLLIEGSVAGGGRGGGKGTGGGGGKPPRPPRPSPEGMPIPSGAWDAVKKIYAPESRGPQARAMSGIVKESAAHLDRRRAVAQEATKVIKAKYDNILATDKGVTPKLPGEDVEAYKARLLADNPTLKFIDDIERGKSTSTDAMNLRQILDSKWKEVQRLRGESAFIENYFPHIWEDPNKSGSILSRMFGKRPLKGPQTWRYQRTIPYTIDGIAEGLTPVFKNPVDFVLAKASEMDRYIVWEHSIRTMKKEGLVRFFKQGKAPEGWIPIDDPAFKPKYYAYAVKHNGPIKVTPELVAEIAKSDTIEPMTRRVLVEPGKWYAPEPAALIINRYVGPGLQGRGGLYDPIHHTANMLNQYQLGMSFFHMHFTGLDSSISSAALGLQELWRGEFGKAGKHIALGVFPPAAAPLNLYRGNKYFKAYMHPDAPYVSWLENNKIYNPDAVMTAKIMDAVVKGGGGAKMDAFYYNRALEQFKQAFKSKEYLQALKKSPGALLELVAKPTMEWWVPRQKLGVFAEMAKSRLEYWEKQGHTPTEIEMREAFGADWRSIDNRMGQLRYPDRHWDKKWKDATLTIIRSPGWTIGTFDEIGGGLYDIKSIASKNLSPRTAYALALAGLYTAWNGMLTGLFTGTKPEGEDWFFFRTGRTNPDGTPERGSLATYGKDVLAVLKHPFDVLFHKLNPLPSAGISAVQNTDFYGQEIRDPADKWYKQAADVGKFALKQYEPFAWRNIQYRMGGESGTGVIKRLMAGDKDAIRVVLESEFGILPAPRYLTRSKAEELIAEYDKRHFSSIKSKDAFDKRVNKIAAQKDVAMGEQDIQKIADEHKLSYYEVESVMRNIDKPYLVRKIQLLTPKEAVEVYKVANKDEKDVIHDALEQKIMNSKVLTDEEREQFLQDIGEDWKFIQ